MWPHVSTNYMIILRPIMHVEPKLQFKILFWLFYDFYKDSGVSTITCVFSYVEIKCQLDATEVFIADLIACLTTARNTTGSNHRIILLSS